MSVAKVEGFSSAHAMDTKQNIVRMEKERHDSLNNVLRNPIKDPFLPFSRVGDSSFQLIKLLHALDPQGSSKISKDSKVDNQPHGKEQYLNGVNSFESDAVKNYVHSFKDNGAPTRGSKSSFEPIQTLRFPEAVVAFAQAAAKPNGEPEKYLPGWPLLSKVQLQKCDKCSREFCSTINYRRHTRVHRRSLNIDKDSSRNRELLGAFWDKLSVDDAKDIVSFKDVTIEEVTGSSLIRSLESLFLKPVVSLLPHMYVEAGASLLEVIQANSSRFPISSQKLFNILDDASERTFMSTGTAGSMQKFVFDGEAGKNALEMKNLVACTSFLLEQKLVKAWLTEKDAEALRCQKLLVEEEEAAQKRQAELMERKRLKKLKQKLQKAKETADSDRQNTEASSSDTIGSTSTPTEAPSPRDPSELDLENLGAPFRESSSFLVSFEYSHSVVEPNISQKHVTGQDADQIMNKQMRSATWQSFSSRYRAVPVRNIHSGPYSGQFITSKTSIPVKHGNSFLDSKSIAPASGLKMWARKTKSESEEGSYSSERVEKKDQNQPVQSGNCEVLIGTINVPIKDGNSRYPNGISLRHNSSNEVEEADPTALNRSELMPCTESDGRETSMVHASLEAPNGVSPDEICQGSNVTSNERCKDSLKVFAVAKLPGPIPFSADLAEAFLLQRWKETIAEDHVLLVVPSGNEASSGSLDITECDCDAAPNHSANSERSILGSAENRMAKGSVELAVPGASKARFRAKPKKSYELKYVPKQKNNIPEG